MICYSGPSVIVPSPQYDPNEAYPDGGGPQQWKLHDADCVEGIGFPSASYCCGRDRSVLSGASYPITFAFGPMNSIILSFTTICKPVRINTNFPHEVKPITSPLNSDRLLFCTPFTMHQCVVSDDDLFSTYIWAIAPKLTA